MKIIKEIGRNPNVDWLIILFLSLVITGSLGFISFSLYNAVTSGSIEGNEGQTNSSFRKLNEKGITSVIDAFVKKEEVGKAAKSGYSRTSDPSV